MAETSTMRKWDKRKTIELIRIIFEHRENISDKQNTEAWNDIVKHLNNKQFNRKKAKVKEKWRSIIADYGMGRFREKAEFYTEVKEKVGVILSARRQQSGSSEDEDENLTDDKSSKSSSEDSIPTNEYREKINELTCKKLELETHILEIQLNDLKKRASGGDAPFPLPNIAFPSQLIIEGGNSLPQGVPNPAETGEYSGKT